MIAFTFACGDGLCFAIALVRVVFCATLIITSLAIFARCFPVEREVALLF
jgi:hypothetical protein